MASMQDRGWLWQIAYMSKRPQLLLVDVQNVLHAVGELRRIMRERDPLAASDALADRLAHFAEVWLFEDGGPRQPQRLSASTWRVGSGHEAADNQIIAWLQRHPRRRPVTLVSADRDLCLRAMRASSAPKPCGDARAANAAQSKLWTMN